MGTGICGAILLKFAAKSNLAEYSVDGFLDNYNLVPKEKNARNEVYVIKEDVLLQNYSNFLTEFYDLIGVKGIQGPYSEDLAEEELKRLLSCKTRTEFDEVFDRDIRNTAVPCIDYGLSCLGCDEHSSFIFYSGSYKAYLEEYSTFMHMERMLAKAMVNPLRNAVKFGIFG